MADAAQPSGVVAFRSEPPPDAIPAPRPRRWLRASFCLAVLVPLAAAALYFGVLASDRYVAGAGFAVRGLDSATPVDGFGALTGIVSTGSTTSDSYIVLNYLESRDLVDAIDAEIPLRAAFSGPGVDWISSSGAEGPIEDLVAYWQRRIATRFDPASGLVTFEIEAFTPEDAHAIAGLVLERTRSLVNELSVAARADALRFAEAEVARAEARLADALGALREFRASERSLDPPTTAELELTRLSEIEARLMDLRTRMAALAGRIDTTSPAMVALEREADALETELAGLSGRGTGEIEELSGQLAAFEALQVAKVFAEQSYASALASLETARSEADRHQRYLAVYRHPARPEEPLYPRRVVTILMVAVGATAIWSVATLIVLTVRDHLE